MGVHEADPLPAERHQSIDRWGIGSQRRRAEQKCLLIGPFVFVEQHHHQGGPAAEPAEQRAFADAGGCGDVVHGDGIRAVFGDQAAGRLEQECAIAGRVTSLLWGPLRREQRQVTQPLDAAHPCTLAWLE